MNSSLMQYILLVRNAYKETILLITYGQHILLYKQVVSRGKVTLFLCYNITIYILVLVLV